MAEPFEFKLVIVTGAIRSGSTLMRAVCATGPETHALARPSSHLFALMQPYLEGRLTFDSHASYFFETQEDFAAYQAGLVRQAITAAWQHLGRPKTLVMGDPTLAPAVPVLYEMLPEAHFVLALRDPRGIVTSRLTVMKRMQGIAHLDNNEISNIRGLMAPICEEVNKYYPFLPDDDPRVTLVRYEDVCAENFWGLAAAMQCGPDAFDLPQLWAQSAGYFPEKDPWWSPFYGQGLTTAPCSSWEQLKPNLQKFVMRRCKSLYDRFYGQAHG